MTWTAAADEPSASLAERVAAIKKENQELEQWFREELRAANHDNEKVLKANREYQEANRKLAARLKTLIKENPGRPEAFDAVLVLIGQLRYYLDAEETRIVLDHHLANPEMGRLRFLLRYRAGEP